MKKKLFKISIVLTVVFFLVAVAAFFLMNNAAPAEPETEEDPYDVSEIVESIEFLKLNTAKEVKAYAEENPIYIQTSDDETLFGIGELYVEESPVTIFYSLNKDKSIKRIDGYYSLPLSDKSAEGVSEYVSFLNRIAIDYFGVTYFDHSMFDEQGAPMVNYDETAYEQMLQGKASYGLSIIDGEGTYWYISASITDGEKLDVEFFRNFDLSIYKHLTPNIDLRTNNETGE